MEHKIGDFPKKKWVTVREFLGSFFIYTFPFLSWYISSFWFEPANKLKSDFFSYHHICSYSWLRSVICYICILHLLDSVWNDQLLLKNLKCSEPSESSHEKLTFCSFELFSISFRYLYVSIRFFSIARTKFYF